MRAIFNFNLDTDSCVLEFSGLDYDEFIYVDRFTVVKRFYTPLGVCEITCEYQDEDQWIFFTQVLQEQLANAPPPQ